MRMYWREPSLFRYVRRAAQINGRGKAIQTADGSQSWSEFEAEVIEIARGLRQIGLRSGDRLALISENSKYLIKAWYAGLCAGCVLVPINIKLNEGEIAACVADSEAKGIVISPEQASRIRFGALPSCVDVVISTECAGG